MQRSRHLVQRNRFDHFLVEQAVKAGATLRERTPLRDIERERSRVFVRAGGETFEGRTLVAADGANGETAKRAGLTVPRWRILALEGNLTPDGRFPERWQTRVGINLGAVPGGYHWLFPKGDHLNIGIGGLPSVGSALRRKFEEAVRGYGFDPATLWGVRAAPLPIRRPDTPLIHGALLLVGDAAGLVDLLTGEGIYGAIWSGQAAAKHLALYLDGKAPDLEGYRQEVERELIPELQIAFQMWSFFHLAPATIADLLWNRSAGKLSRLIGWTRFCRLTQGEDQYRDLKRAFGPLWFPVDFTVRPSVFPLITKFLGILQR